jgi:predicted helicase
LLKQGNGATQSLSLYRYEEDGTRTDNITEFGLQQFHERYGIGSPKIGKRDVFAYVYAVLHDPSYREKYLLNLKRELPRIPLHDDFWKWASWGEELLELHVKYESVKPYALDRRESKPSKGGRARLKAEKENNTIILDESTHEFV